jgi:DNA integrity scanning protein DisA with diadenylate cyclase activity
MLPDYAWEFVEPKVRAALLDAFSFERRELAQDVTKSEVISVIQRVRGVAFVDLDLLAAVSESAVEAELIRTTINAGKKPTDGDLPSFSQSLVSVKHRVIVEPARANLQAMKFSERIAPAQIAVLLPALPETLLLTEVKA